MTFWSTEEEEEEEIAPAQPVVEDQTEKLHQKEVEEEGNSLLLILPVLKFQLELLGVLQSIT